MLLKNLIVPPSLKEMAFQSIKAAIFSNKLEPGKIYNEQGLAKELGISKTPVREAFCTCKILIRILFHGEGFKSMF